MKIYLFTVFTCLFAAIHCASAAEYYVDAGRMNDTTDDTVYFQNLINSLPGGATLHIPPGTLTLTNTINIPKSLTMRGADFALTELRFLAAGGFNATNGFDVADLSMVTTVAHAGIAIYVTGGRGDVNHLVIKGATPNYFWTKSVVFEAISGNVNNCIFIGKKDGFNGTEVHVEHFGKTGGGGKVGVSGSDLIGARIGFYVHNTDAEGHGSSGNNVRDVQIAGLKGTSEPIFAWTHAWIQASEFGVQYDGCRDTGMRGSVVEITGATNPDAAAVTFSYRTQQNCEIRNNLFYAPIAVHVMTHRAWPNTGGSSMVDSLVVAGNFIQGAKTAYALVGSETRKVFCGGNVLDGVQKEFTYVSNGDNFFRTKLEVIP